MEAGSLLPSCGYQGSNADLQVWWEVPLSPEPSCQPGRIYHKGIILIFITESAQEKGE